MNLLTIPLQLLSPPGVPVYIELGDVIRVVETGDTGAIVHLSGVVRNNTEGREGSYLEYKAYPPMAEKKIAEIAQEIHEKLGLDRVAMMHRVGRLEIGEASVALAVASPHHKEIFEACHYAINRLKQIVPIWKREVWADGEEEWVKPDPVFFQSKA